MTDPLLTKAKEVGDLLNCTVIEMMDLPDVDLVMDHEKSHLDKVSDYIRAKNALEYSNQTIPEIVEGIKNRDCD